MDKMMCHYIDNVIIQLFYNDLKLTINKFNMNINRHNEL